jgi:phage gp46-like protein
MSSEGQFTRTAGAAQVLLMLDFPCAACGLPLLGEPIDGSCPGCGTPIERTVGAEDLILAPLGLLRRMRGALRLVFVCVLVQVAYLFVFSFILRAARSQVGSGPGVFEAVTNSIGVVISLLIAHGWWGFAGHARVLGGRVVARARLVVRATVLFQTVLACVAYAWTGYAWLAQGSAAADLALIVALVSGGLVFLAGVVKFFFAMPLMREAAAGLHDPELVAEIRRRTWFIPVMFVFGSLILIGPLWAFYRYIATVDDLSRRFTQILYAREATEQQLAGTAVRPG